MVQLLKGNGGIQGFEHIFGIDNFSGQEMATNKDRQGASCSYHRDNSSSDTEDYHDVDERRRRVFKSRLRYGRHF